MSNVDASPMLAGLIRQAEQEGADLVTLRAVVEEASQLGAERACRRLGLDDGGALADIVEMRATLAGWRDARKAAWNAAVTWTVRGLVAGLLAAIAVKLHLADLVRQ